MTDVINFTKKAFTWSVVVMTIAWSVGLSALAPLAANAAECPALEAGDLFKVEGNTAVYLVNSDMERMYFPNSEVYHTWYADFSGVVEIASECVSAYPNSINPAGVNYRPGSRLVKVVISPDVYAVGPDNMRHKIGSEAEAAALYGDNWASLVRDVHDFHWPNYTDGAEVDGLHDGMLVMEAEAASTAAAGDVYYVSGGMLHMVDGDLPGFVSGDVQTVSSDLFGALDMGDSVTAASVTADPSQGAGGTPADSGDSTPVVSGDLTVSLSADTPAASVLSAATVYNHVLNVRLSAGDEAVTVDALTLTKAGLASNTQIDGISVWVDGYRKGDVMSSFNVDNEVTVGFSGDPITVPANGSVTVTVAINIASGVASGTVSMSVASASHVDSNSNVGGSFPVTGGTFSIINGAATLAGVTVTGQSVGGQSTEPTSSDSGQLEIGQTKEIAKVKFTEAGTNEASIEQLVFYVEGTVQDDDLQNFEVYSPTNELLGSTAMMNDRYVTVKLDTPYEMPKGTSRTLTLKATAMDGASRWFRVQLQSDYDLLISDADTGYHILPTDGDSTWNAVSSTNGYFKLKEGTLTVIKRTDSVSGQIAAGATDISLGKFDVKAVGEEIEVRKIGLQIATSSVATRLTGNVKVVVDGATVLTTSAATNNLYSSASTQYTLSSYVNIPSGETKTFEIIGSIDTSAVSTSEYQAKVGNFYLKRLNTKDFKDNQPSSSLTAANNLTMSSNTFTITEDTSLGDKTIAPGGEHTLGQWVIKAPSAQGAKVSAATFSFASNGLTVADHIQNLTLMSGELELGSVVSAPASSSNSYTFDNLELDANETAKLTLKGTVISSAPTSKTLTATLSSLTWTGVTTQNSADDTAGYGAQTNTINTATVTISAASDSTTIASVYVPSTAEKQLGKWKVEVNNDAAHFEKIRLYLYNETDAADTTAGNFTGLNLYDSADMSTPLNASAESYVPGSGNGYVEFSGLDWTVSADTIKYLVLKGQVNGSGTMNAASVNYFAAPVASTTNYTIKSNGSDISASATISTPSSTRYLFHNAAPTVAKFDVGTSLSLASQAKIFGYTVTNNGDREMRVATNTLAVAVSGLTGNGSATGTLYGFQLWEANSAGEPATQLAVASTTGTMCLSGGAGEADCTNATTVSVSFGENNDVNSLFDNLTVPAGGSRTFIMTANTTDVLDAKTQGTVSVSVTLDGATGFVSSDDSTQEGYWANGVILYYYTPVGGSELGPYSGSDSYDVVGEALTRSA